MSDYLEVAVVVARLNVSPATIYRLIQQGKLRAARLGVSRGIRVPRQAVAEFEEKRRIEAEDW